MQTKIKKSSVRNKKELSPIAVDQKKVDVLLKAELHYFKGMSMFLMIIMFCLFLAFGSLFSAMYLETRMMRQSLENITFSVPADYLEEIQ